MSFPKNLAYYKDIAKVLDQAVRGGTLNYRLGSNKEAVRWRAMAYMYRALVREKEHSDRYDSIVLRIVNNVVEIAAQTPPMGELMSDNTVINVSSLEPMDNYEAAALALAKKLQGGSND